MLLCCTYYEINMIMEFFSNSCKRTQTDQFLTIKKIVRSRVNVALDAACVLLSTMLQLFSFFFKFDTGMLRGKF